jgi:curved DNA-binding protein
VAVKFQDYYETLGVQRSASQDEVQQAYRKLARRFHPDVNKNRDAEEKFKQINEAYEVLKDPEKRRRYDALGDGWRTGEDFTPPPGWDFGFGGAGASRGTQGFDFGDLGGGFSDFFDQLFGRAGARSGSGTGGFGGFEGFGGFGRETEATQGEDTQAELTITLEDAYHGGRRTVTLTDQEPDVRVGGGGRAGGPMRQTTRTFEVTIPSGITDGKKLRLRGQGEAGFGGRGDLYITIHIAPHARFRVRERDLEVDVPVTPWEAALGAELEVPTVEGRARVRIPAGIRADQRIRIKGRGLGSGAERGDLYAAVRIEVPRRLSDREKELFEELARQSRFNPRLE